VSDIDTGVVDSLKVLDPRRPIREADFTGSHRNVPEVPEGDIHVKLGSGGGTAVIPAGILAEWGSVEPVARMA